MKRFRIYSLAIVAALVPAALGLWGNASFSRDLPVRVPARAETTPVSASPAGVDDRDGDSGPGGRSTDWDDHGRDDHGRDDHGRDDHGRDDHGRDDHGGDDDRRRDDSGGSGGHD